MLSQRPIVMLDMLGPDLCEKGHDLVFNDQLVEHLLTEIIETLLLKLFKDVFQLVLRARSTSIIQSVNLP